MWYELKEEMVIKKEKIEKLKYFLAEYDKIKDEQRAYKRLYIMETDPNAPLCINCRFCQQSGFLFICPIFQLPEDGEVVGNLGIVYYRRKGHKSKTYPNVPTKPEECSVFKPLIV